MFETDHRPPIGVAEQIAPGVRAVTAPNASPMTFTGTRSYLVGEGQVALIDPGPTDPVHRDAILGALLPGERISHILLTHTHVDHSPLARPLADETGAEVLAYGPHGAGLSPTMAALRDSGAIFGGGEGADLAFFPDRLLSNGETLEGNGWALTAIHTPGHLSNHLSFALEGSGVVFSGDHIMGWATTLVSPPEGDLTSFMASLETMAARSDSLYLPGHGAPVERPLELVEHIRTHRLGREAQILEALAEGAALPEDLTRMIYTGVDPVLLPAAARNVFAHLIDLIARQRVVADDDIGPNARFRLR